MILDFNSINLTKIENLPENLQRFECDSNKKKLNKFFFILLNFNGTGFDMGKFNKN